MTVLFMPHAYDDFCVIDGIEPLHIDSFGPMTSAMTYLIGNELCSNAFHDVSLNCTIDRRFAP